MYDTHPCFKEPQNADVKIWRYLDFTKYVSLLDKKSLFFVQSDKLEDKFEGALTKQNTKDDKFTETQGGYRKNFFINSWYMNEYESAAMWKLYLKSEEGVAIQTTFNGLKSSFKNYSKETVNVGVIEYTDYDNEIIPRGNIFNRFLHKRNSFEHEKELRAIILYAGRRDELVEDGIYANVDLEHLINKVYISPYSKQWFYELVHSVSAKYNLKAEIVNSSLMASPIF